MLSHFKISDTQGGFTAAVGSFFGDVVTSLGDFNGDGTVDIAAGIRQSNTVFLLWTTGHTSIPAVFIFLY